MLSTIKYTVTVDKLTLSLSPEIEKFNYKYISTLQFKGNSYSLSSQIELRKCNKKLDKYCLHSFQVHVEGQKIGMLHTDSRLPQQENLVKFEFSNHVFYAGKGFNYYLDSLQSVGLYVHSVSYMEIALDMQLRQLLMPQLSQMERNSTLDINNTRAKYKPLRAKTVCNKLSNGAQYVFGNSVNKANGSGKQISIYDKTKELESNEKEHIINYFRGNGFNMLATIERVEARISSKWLSANKIKLSRFDMTDAETLITLFIKAVGDVFKFVPVDAVKKANAAKNYTYGANVLDLLPLQDL